MIHVQKTKKISAIFQCNYVNIPAGDDTIHMLTHYVGCSEDKIWQYRKTFVDKNHDWVHKVGCDILEQKKLSLADYTNTVLISGVLWDELALLIFARMYKNHIFFLCQEINSGPQI